MSLAVVVPAHNAADHLGVCLDALIADGFEPPAIVVVDDGSTDATGDIARGRGVSLCETPQGPVGPAAARNLGVAATRTDLVLFVDADVAVAPGTRAKLRDIFGQPAPPDAVFGSYDAAPAAPRLVSQYRNLLHHHTHQMADPHASTFWTGLGAVTRRAFDRAGGFDPARRYLEDVAFGRTIIQAGGQITLVPDLQGKHLKDWTLGSMFWTDWKGRAVPWARMQARGEIDRPALTSSRLHRANAALVWLGLAAGLAAPFTPLGLWGFIGAVMCFLAANLGLFRLLFRQGGPGLAAASVGYHALHYIAATFGLVEVLFSRRTADHDGRNSDWT
ncbi:MAG: glycosyltransferase [Pseudomonadota bacterium]